MNSEIRLNPPSRWAMSIYSNDQKNSKPSQQQQKSYKQNDSPSKSQSNKFQTPQIIPYEGQGKNKYALYPTNLMDEGPLDADVELALTGISSTDQVKLNFNRVLNTRKGDLAMIQREVFKCRPNIPHLEHIELILKRVECIDRRVYDLKVHESDTFMKYRKHPNFISLYSYWSEPTTNKYAYRNLIQLFEEGAYGDIGGTIMMSPVLPATRILLKYLCDIAKALSAIHSSNIIHAAVRPSNIYICQGNEAKLGEFKKVELDAARQTNQLSSKILIGQAIPKTLIYWAPELFSADRYDTGIDMWALGITFYQILTGEQPFSIINEEQFKSEVIHGKIRWMPLKGSPVFLEVIQNLLQINPKNRWTANRVLYYCQDFFAAEIQNAWRGYYKRREFKRISLALVKIQACIKGFLTRIHYQRDRVIARENAALMIQKKWRSHAVSRGFKIARRALMRCQANVLARQMKRAYTKMKIDTVMAQAMIRRYLAMSWYHQLKKKRFELESDLDNINSMISKYNQESQMFQNQFSTKKVGAPLQQFGNLQGQGRGRDDDYDERGGGGYYRQQRGGQQQQRQGYNQDYQDFEERKGGDIMRSQKSIPQEQYMQQDNRDDKARRIIELTRNSRPLELKMQHAYSYNQWDNLYEPYNVVENVLKDNETVYKAMNPVLDFTLHHGVMCFIGEIYLSSVEPGPGDIEIYVGKALDRWDLLTVHRCGRELEQRILFKQEVHAKYLRLKCLDNLRGGNLCCVRFVQVFGVPL